jgi:predicted nucleotidyltransferase
VTTARQLAEVLARRAAVRREEAHRRSLSAKAQLVARLRALPGIDRAWLIGSLGKPRFGEGSDADVVVEGLSLEAWGRTWSELQLGLPVSLDLMRIEELEPEFAARVRTEGELVVGT